MKFFKLLTILFLSILIIFTASCDLSNLNISSQGESAYEIAVRNGFVGTEKEWLESLKGSDGKDGESLNIMDIYQEAVNEGFDGTYLEFIAEYFADTEMIKGESAFDIFKKYNPSYSGTEEEWVQSLKGEQGVSGADGRPGSTVSLYEVYQELVEHYSYGKSYYEFVNEYLDVAVTRKEEEIIATELLSCVKVTAADTYFVTEEYYNDTTKLKTVKGQTGSGVIYRMNKSAGDIYVITNYHVVYNESGDAILPYIFVYLYGYEYFFGGMQAEFLGGSATYDIAVIKVSGNDLVKTSDCLPATLFDSNDVVVGMTAYAVGNPEGDGLSLTKGVVSVDSETILMSPITSKATLYQDTGKVQMRVMRVDTAVNSGNSGGGLFNEDGYLIGIVNAKLMTSDVENIGYAIPVNIAKIIADKVIANEGTGVQTVGRCLMGVMVQIKSCKAYYEDGLTKLYEEIMIAQVSAGSPAYGKVQVGDFIKAITLNGVRTELRRQHILIDVCMTANVGDTATLEILRDGQTIFVDITYTSETIEY